jgi:hypothetical protein
VEAGGGKVEIVPDVAAGAAIGTAVGRAVVLVDRREQRERRERAQVAIGPTVGPRGQPGLALDASL